MPLWGGGRNRSRPSRTREQPLFSLWQGEPILSAKPLRRGRGFLETFQMLENPQALARSGRALSHNGHCWRIQATPLKLPNEGFYGHFIDTSEWPVTQD